MANSIDRQTAKEISQKIADYVKSLESEYGVVLNKRSCRYDEASINITLKCSLNQETLEKSGVLTSAQKAYDYEASVNKRLPARGSIVIDGYGDEFEILEWIPKGRKYKVALKNVETGKKYKFTKESVMLLEVVK